MFFEKCLSPGQLISDNSLLLHSSNQTSITTNIELILETRKIILS